MTRIGTIRHAIASRLDFAVPDLPKMVWSDGLDPTTAHILAWATLNSVKPLDQCTTVARGTVRLDIRYPVDDNELAEDMLDKIERALPFDGPNSELVGSVYVDSFVGEAGRVEGSWYVLPVTIGITSYQMVMANVA